MTSKQQVDAANAERDCYRFIAAECVAVLTADQKARLRDKLACLELEGKLWP